MSHKITFHQDKGVFIRIIIQRSTKYIKIPVEIDKVHWSEETARAKTSFKLHKAFNQYIDDISERLEECMIHCHREQFNADTAKEYIVDKLFTTLKKNTLRGFSEVMISEFNRKQEPKTAQWISTAVNSFLFELGKSDIQLNQITYNHLLEYRNKLQFRPIGKQSKPCKPNTINNYLRAIRNVYNSAEKRGMFIQKGKSPFAYDNLIPSITKSTTRNITLHDIQSLENNEFANRYQQEAVDMWLLGFYLQGADYIDVANLTRSNVFNGYIRFTRSKTNQPVCVKILPKMQAIFDKYHDKSQRYLVPILHKQICSPEDLRMYEQRRKSQNLHTKNAAAAVGINSAITTKWLRHSWITLAKKLYVDESIREQAVGHRNMKGSQSHYADDYDQYIIDAANQLVLGYIDHSQYLSAIHHAPMPQLAIVS